MRKFRTLYAAWFFVFLAIAVAIHGAFNVPWVETVYGFKNEGWDVAKDLILMAGVFLALDKEPEKQSGGKR